MVLIQLGEAHHTAGQLEEAKNAWRAALTIRDDDRVRARLWKADPD